MTKSELKDIIKECYIEIKNDNISITESKTRLYTDEECEKICVEYRQYIIDKINKSKYFKNAKASSSGLGIDINFLDETTKLDNKDIYKYIDKHLVSILNEAVKKFNQKYKTKFYWNEKVMTKNGILIELDSDCWYDKV